jgi:hypothetical protein
MSGNLDKSDWVKNLLKEPKVSLRISGETFAAVASLLNDKTLEGIVRMKMATKYNEMEGNKLSEWAQTALVVKFSPFDSQT